MSPEELAKKLKDLGLKEGAWAETEGGEIPPPIISAYKPMLIEVRKIVSSELEKKVLERGKLQEMLGKLRHGGAISNG